MSHTTIGIGRPGTATMNVTGGVFDVNRNQIQRLFKGATAKQDAETFANSEAGLGILAIFEEI
jgi:hypothetical protein